MSEQCIVSYRNIEGFPGYRVGDDGTVWSQWSWAGCGSTWRKLKPSLDLDGYPKVSLRVAKNVSISYKVSRLVLTAFCGPRPSGMCGCHNDGNPQNNHISNLRWDTLKANQADRIKHGTDCRGEKARLAKINTATVRSIRTLHSQIKGHRKKVPNGTIDRICKELGVTRSCVEHVVSGSTWKHIT